LTDGSRKYYNKKISNNGKKYAEDSGTESLRKMRAEAGSGGNTSRSRWAETNWAFRMVGV